MQIRRRVIFPMGMTLTPPPPSLMLLTQILTDIGTSSERKTTLSHYQEELAPKKSYLDYPLPYLFSSVYIIGKRFLVLLRLAAVNSAAGPVPAAAREIVVICPTHLPDCSGHNFPL